MHRNRRMVVALDRSERDAELLRYASMVWRLGTITESHFTHVLPNTGESLSSQVCEREEADLQANVAASISDAPESMRQVYRVVAGPLIDRLLEYVAEVQADLLLVGHRRDHPGRRALARRMAMSAPCSVWVAPQGSPPKLGRIVVPVDFSEHSADAMRVAVSMARLSGAAECVAVHVYFNEAVITYEGYDQVLRGEEEKAYRQFMESVDCHDVPVRAIFEEGVDVASVIGRVADREAADLIVMSTRGRSRSASILLGSVTEDMIIQTRVPLLAVKHFGARVEVLQALLDRLRQPR